MIKEPHTNVNIRSEVTWLMLTDIKAWCDVHDSPGVAQRAADV